MLAEPRICPRRRSSSRRRRTRRRSRGGRHWSPIPRRGPRIEPEAEGRLMLSSLICGCGRPWHADAAIVDVDVHGTTHGPEPTHGMRNSHGCDTPGHHRLDASERVCCTQGVQGHHERCALLCVYHGIQKTRLHHVVAYGHRCVCAHLSHAHHTPNDSAHGFCIVFGACNNPDPTTGVAVRATVCA